MANGTQLIGSTVSGEYNPGAEPFRQGWQALPSATKLQAMIYGMESAAPVSIQSGEGQKLFVQGDVVSPLLMRSVRAHLPDNHWVVEQYFAWIGTSECGRSVAAGILVRTKGPGVISASENWLAFDAGGSFVASQRIPPAHLVRQCARASPRDR
jgi:hypothetical protein